MCSHASSSVSNKSVSGRSKLKSNSLVRLRAEQRKVPVFMKMNNGYPLTPPRASPIFLTSTFPSWFCQDFPNQLLALHCLLSHTLLLTGLKSGPQVSLRQQLPREDKEAWNRLASIPETEMAFQTNLSYSTNLLEWDGMLTISVQAK